MPTDASTLDAAFARAVALRNERLRRHDEQRRGERRIRGLLDPANDFTPEELRHIEAGIGRCQSFRKVAGRTLYSGLEGLEITSTFIAQQVLWRLSPFGEPDVAAARRWVLKVLRTKEVRAKMIAPIWGFSVDAPTNIASGMDIVPLADLAVTSTLETLRRKSRQIDAVWTSVDNFSEPACAFVIELSRFPYISGTADASERRSTLVYELAELCSVIQGLCVNRPIVFGSWIEYEDPEFDPISYGFKMIWHPPEVFPKIYDNVEVDEAHMRRIIRRYRKMSHTDRMILERALRRYALSQCRLYLEDRALDLAIAFETAVTDEGDSRLGVPPTYKVATRTAQMIGGTLDQRIATRNVIKELYSQRSVTVHGGKTKKWARLKKAIDDADSQFPKLIEKIIGAAGQKNWADIELEKVR